MGVGSQLGRLPHQLSVSAPLGYGDPVTTVVSFGPSSSSNKFVTTYFRRTFNADMVFDASLTGTGNTGPLPTR